MSPVHPSCYESTASVGCDVIHSISKEPNFPALSLYLRLPVFSLKSTWSNQANTLCSSVIYHTVPYPGTPLVHFPSMGAHNAGFSFWLLWLPSRPFVCCSWAFCVESEWHSFGFTHFLFFFDHFRSLPSASFSSPSTKASSFASWFSFSDKRGGHVVFSSCRTTLFHRYTETNWVRTIICYEHTFGTFSYIDT